MVMGCRTHDDVCVAARIENQHDPVYGRKTRKNRSKSKHRKMLPNDIAKSSHPTHI